MPVVDCTTGKTREHTAKELAEIEAGRAAVDDGRDMSAELVARIDELQAAGKIDDVAAKGSKALLGLE